MMGGTVIFTYKRRRFSSKPHKIEGLQPDPTFNPQDEVFINKDKSRIESQKPDEAKVELHKICQAQTELCKTDVPQSEQENSNQLFELQTIEQTQIELLPKDEPEIKPQNELQNINGNQIKCHTEIQIVNERPLEPDNIDNLQNEMHKIGELHVNPESIDELQCSHKKVCVPQSEQEISEQTQLEPEKVGVQPEADFSAEPQIQESLIKSSEAQIGPEKLDETQSDYPVEERAEESHNEIQNFQNDPPRIDKLRSGASINPPFADLSDELDSELITQTCRGQFNEDSTEVDNGEDAARVVTFLSSETPTDPNRGKQESNAGLLNSDETKNHFSLNEQILNCDRDKPTLTSRQVRPIIDLTKLPTEAELENEMEELPPESISGSWRDKEVEFLKPLEKDLKAEDKQMKGEKLMFDLRLAPDLSLRPTFDQDILGTLQSQARPKSLSAGTSRFGLPFPTSTMDPKGKNVNSLGTRDFRATCGMRDPFEHMHKQVLDNIYTGSRILQDKLKYNNRTNDSYNTTSAYGASSYKLHDWSEEELDFLWIGVRRYGPNNWEAVLRDPRFRFTKFKTVEDLAERWEVEQRKLFSCPLQVPVTLPPPRTTNWHSNLESHHRGDPYLEGSSYKAYNSSAGRFWHHSMGPAMVPMPDMIPRRGRAKYQIRRAPKAQTVTCTPSPPISYQPSCNINNNKRDTELPHWLREVTEAPLGLTGVTGFASELLNRGTVKRKGIGDEVASEPLIEQNVKFDGRSSFNLSKKQSLGPDKLVILDSDGVSSEETLSA